MISLHYWSIYSSNSAMVIYSWEMALFHFVLQWVCLHFFRKKKFCQIPAIAQKLIRYKKYDKYIDSIHISNKLKLKWILIFFYKKKSFKKKKNKKHKYIYIYISCFFSCSDLDERKEVNSFQLKLIHWPFVSFFQTFSSQCELHEIRMR